MKIKRIEELLDILFSQENYITINYLADQVGVSDKTVRSDLDKIEEFIEDQNIKLIRKTGSGVLLEGHEQDKLLLKNKLVGMPNNNPNFSSRQRIFIITSLLLMGRKDYYISHLSEILYYSRSTIHQDLRKVEKILESFKIKLIRERNRPIKIEGKERRIRNCLVKIILEHTDIHKIAELIINTGEGRLNSTTERDDEVLLHPLSVKTSELKMIIFSMKSSNDLFTNKLPLQSFVTLLMFVLVSFIRYREGHIVQLSSDFVLDLEDRELYEEVSIICDKLSTVFTVSLPEIEKRYIQVYWLSQNRDKKDQDEYIVIAENMAKKLIAFWSSEVDIINPNSHELFDSLKMHLTSSIIRFEQGIYFKNTLLSQIKNLHPKEFKLVQSSLKQFDSLFDEPIADDEAVYITLHLLTYLEKMKENVKVLLVSHISLGGELFIKEKLTNKVSGIDIVESVNYFKFYDIDLSQINLIISTIQLKINEDIPFILINPLLKKEEIKSIQDIVEEF